MTSSSVTITFNNWIIQNTHFTHTTFSAYFDMLFRLKLNHDSRGYDKGTSFRHNSLSVFDGKTTHHFICSQSFQSWASLMYPSSLYGVLASSPTRLLSWHSSGWNLCDNYSYWYTHALAIFDLIFGSTGIPLQILTTEQILPVNTLPVTFWSLTKHLLEPCKSSICFKWSSIAKLTF